jgi:hypothetical protein
MIKDLAELKTRLLVHFEILDHEHPLHPHGEDVPPHPFPFALLAAVDLIEEIMRNLERDDADQIKLQAVVRAWEQRSFDGRPAPRVV